MSLRVESANCMRSGYQRIGDDFLQQPNDAR